MNSFFADTEDLFLLVVVFVLNVAENGLHEVFECDETRRAAVFIDDDGDLQAALLELFKELAALFSFPE